MHEVLKSFMPHIRIERFDAVEVHPVREDEHGCEQINLSEWGADSTATYFWSVYLHYDRNHVENTDFGGLECVADYVLEIDARAFASELEAHLKQVRT